MKHHAQYAKVESACEICRAPFLPYLSRGVWTRTCGTKCGFELRERNRTPQDAGPVLDARSEFVTESGCRLWTGSVNDFGYGEVHHNGRKQRAHRVAWQLAHGPIPRGQCVLHRCDVPSCVNVNHLFLGTKKDNTDDMIGKGRGRFRPSLGEANGSAKLTEPEVRAIRADGRPPKTIARQYGVTDANVKLIKRRKSWTHLSP